MSDDRLSIYRRILAEHNGETIDGIYVDATSAWACVALHDGLTKEESRTKWLAMPTGMQIFVALKCTAAARK